MFVKPFNETCEYYIRLYIIIHIFLIYFYRGGLALRIGLLQPPVDVVKGD